MIEWDNIRHIYWNQDGTCAIAEAQSWLPGIYATPQAALMAFEVADFKALAQSAAPGPITLEQVEAHIRKEQGIEGAIEVPAQWSFATD